LFYGHHHSYSEKPDADKEAIDDLTRQAKDQTGVMATLTRARVEQLKAEIQAERAFSKGLDRSQKQILKTINAALEISSPSALLNLSPPEFSSLLLNGGLGEAIDGYIDQQNRIMKSIDKVMGATAPEFQMNSIEAQSAAIQTQNVSAIFDDLIVPDISAAVKAGLTDIMLFVPVEVAMSNMATKMKSSRGGQLNAIKTKISQYGRSLTAVAAEAAGLDNYLFTGPRDGITRKFCRALVDLVVDEKQMSKLDNGQGLSVKTSCGGYNCRHSWSPVSEGFIRAVTMVKKAKPRDIAKANAGAR